MRTVADNDKFSPKLFNKQRVNKDNGEDARPTRQHGFAVGAAQGGERGRTAFWCVMANSDSVQVQELQAKVHSECAFVREWVLKCMARSDSVLELGCVARTAADLTSSAVVN